MIQPIRMAFYNTPEIKLIQVDNAYDIEVKSWFDKLLWKILCFRKCARVHFDKEYMVAELLIDPEKDGNLIILEAQAQLMELNKRPKKILLGREDFFKITNKVDNLPYIMQDFSFNTTLRDGFKMYGLDIEVIPHMKGILVI